VTTACGAPNGSGPLNTTADLKNGGVVTYTIAATVTATSGTVKNSASVAPPAGTTNPGTSCTPLSDPNARSFSAGTCTASDLDNVTPVADLVIGKTDNASAVTAGGSTTYTVTVTNNGPSPVTGAVITDPAPAGLTIGAWTCAVTSAGSGGVVTTACGAPNGSGPLNTTANLKNGGVVTYTIAATVTAVGGTVKNAASVAPPAGTTNPGTSCTSLPDPNARSFNAGTCTASDLDDVTPAADLTMRKAGPAQVEPNGALAYTLLVANLGPSAADNALVRDAQAANFTAASVTCGGEAGGAVCPAPENTTLALLQGAGIVVPTLPAGGSLTFTIAGAAAASGTIVNTATVAPPPGTIDPGPENNTSTVTTSIILMSIPTLSSLMLGLLIVLLAAAGMAGVARRRAGELRAGPRRGR